MIKPSRFRGIKPERRPFRWGGLGVRLACYALVMGLTLAWYVRSAIGGHAGPELARLREVRGAAEAAPDGAAAQALVDEAIAASRGVNGYEHRDTFAWATLRKAGWAEDPEERDRLLEEVIDANLGRGEFGLARIAGSTMARRVRGIVDGEGWSRGDGEFLEKYRGYSIRWLRTALSVVWQKKIESGKGAPDETRLLAEYRAWLDDGAFEGRDVNWAWALSREVAATEGREAKLALVDELIARLTDGGDDELIERLTDDGDDTVSGYLVWGMRMRATLLDDKDASLSLYREIDALYREHASPLVRRQVAGALSDWAGMVGKEERLRLFDTILSRYGGETDDWFRSFLDRVAEKRAELVRKQQEAPPPSPRASSRRSVF